MKMRSLVLSVVCGLGLAVQADVASISAVSARATGVGTATVSASVQGTGDVFAEFAHAKDRRYASVKERYVTNGLLAMWDGEDNVGSGVHDATYANWRDLTGRHGDLTFTHAPVIGANYYDLSAGGCGVSAPDIAAAISGGNATVEIVCDVRTVVNDATLFACVDGTDTGSKATGNRIAWLRHQVANEKGYVLGALEYRQTACVGSIQDDESIAAVRTYSFLFGPDSTKQCVIMKDSVRMATVNGGDVAGTVANGWFSLAQRICQAGSSAEISDVRIYCVRVYDHYLTNAERLANYAQDQERFFNAPTPMDLDHPGSGIVKATAFAGTVKNVTGAKDLYVQDGLLAMWDGEDNQGMGAHVADATTWVDLTGNHAALRFDTAPTVGARSYDVSRGGGCIKSCVDIATAVSSGNATIEIVCDMHSLVESGTLFSIVDGTGDAAGNRIAWVMNGRTSSDHQGAIGTFEYRESGSTRPYPSFDQELNKVRSYTFKFGSSTCEIYRDGAATPSASKVAGSTAGNPATATFSIGQRYSQGGKSGTIADMKVYCVRIYNRQLTAEEVVANHAVDVKRFYGTATQYPFCPIVEGADGVVRPIVDGVAVFPVSGLRPDVSTCTVRLFTKGSSPVVSAGAAFVTASERPLSVRYEYLDSQNNPAAVSSSGGAILDLDFAPTGCMPVVEARFQNLGGDGHCLFGVNTDTLGTYFGQFKSDGVSKLRYRVGESGTGGYAALPGVDVYDLVFNGTAGTILNGVTLDPPLASVADAGTVKWMLFGRHVKTATQDYYERARMRVWSFRLWADGTPVRDLVPGIRPDNFKPGMFDRVSGAWLANLGDRSFCAGPDIASMTCADARIESKRLSLKLTRNGNAASSVTVVYGVRHGGSRTNDWEHSAVLDERFAQGQTELSITLPGVVQSGARYVRFFSEQDGWSRSVYLAETNKSGLVIIFR